MSTQPPGLFLAPDPVVHGPGPYPAVVVIHDITGFSEDVKRHAERVAEQGYLVFAPDLYAGGQKIFCIAAAVRDLLRHRGPAIDAVLGARDWLVRREDCGGSVGVIGFCLGGGFALLTAASGFDAAAPFYGVVPLGQDQAMEGACPVVASYGRRDPLLPAGERRLRKSLEARGIEHDIKTYSGVGHSFANQIDLGFATPLVRITGFGYSEGASDDAWTRVFGFFNEHLDGPHP